MPETSHLGDKLACFIPTFRPWLFPQLSEDQQELLTGYARTSVVQQVEILNGVRDPRTPKFTLVSLRVLSLSCSLAQELAMFWLSD